VDYGVDAPGVIRNLFLAGIALLALCRFVFQVTVGGATFVFTPMFRTRDRVYRGWRADDRLIPMQAKTKSIFNGIVVIAVVLWLLSLFGLFSNLAHIRVGS